MKREIAGKRMIVTGASSGIGAATVQALVQAGAQVIAVARNADRITAGTAFAGDITKPDDRQRIIDEAQAKFGGLDALVNIAGIAAWGHFATSTEAINRQILETNFFAPAELIRLAVPLLVKGNQPLIVNLTSMTGRRGMPAWPEYSASKAALVGLTEALRGEMTRFGIDTLTVVPGLTKTNLQSGMLRSEGRVKIPYETGMEASEVAECMIRAMRKGKTEITLGGDARKILLLNKWTPRLLRKLISNRVTKEYAKS